MNGAKRYEKIAFWWMISTVIIFGSLGVYFLLKMKL
jgi:hypothetical protein